MNSRFPLVAELIAEFLGTFVLILLGTGVVAMVVLFPSQTPGEIIHGGYTNITLGWGLAVTMGIYVAGKISGAHLNPAVTLALAVFRGFPWRKVVALLDRASCGSILGGGAGLSKLSPCFPPGRPATGKNRWSLHYVSSLSRPSAGGISGPGDRHRLAAAFYFRHHR